MLRITLAALAASPLIFVGCHSVAESDQPAMSQQTTELEVYNPHWDGDSFMIQVMSNGCTEATDIHYSINDETLTFARAKADPCRMMPHLVSLSFQLQQPFSAIANPILFSTGTGLMGHGKTSH